MDIFGAKILEGKVICLRGEEATRLFYDPAKLDRIRAVPKYTRKLDDQARARRQAMLAARTSSGSMTRFSRVAEEYWKTTIPKWENRSNLVLFEEAQELMFRIACVWAGIPVPEGRVGEHSRDFGLMIDGFGAVGRRYWCGKLARRRQEAWARRMIRGLRIGSIASFRDSPARTISSFEAQEGRPLPIGAAAAELVDMIIPVVAIASYVTFGALALHERPECRNKIREGDEEYLSWFALEVRRFFLSDPFIRARVREEFQFEGHTFKPGILVVLEQYGTNHDFRAWGRPNDFRPERFRNWSNQAARESGYGYSHEQLAIEAIKTAAQFLSTSLEYEVPEQDLSFALSRMPTLPGNGFVMSGVRVVPERPEIFVPAQEVPRYENVAA